MYRIFTLTLLGLVLVSCATNVSTEHRNHPVGDIRSVSSKKEGIACLSGTETSVGQKVSIYESVCKRAYYETPWATKPTVKCDEIKKGEAKVVSNVDDHAVVLKPIGSIEFEPGNIIKLE